MKTIIRQTIIPLSLGVLSGLPALAIEPPADDAPPPPSVKTPASAPAADSKAGDTRIIPPKETSVAYIGVITADVPDMLAAHIGIRSGEGVLVRDLAPDSPRPKAGLVKYDVIIRVSGKTVSSPAELSKLVSAQKPGDEISIDCIHRGQTETKTVKLEERPVRSGGGALSESPNLGHLELDNLPPEQADRIRDMIGRRLQGMRDQQRDFGNELDAPAPRGGGINGFQFKSDSTIRLMDENGSIEMKSSDGSKEITVRDKNNDVSWSGPWDTEQDKAAAPKDIRERIERFKFDENFRGGGFRFQMGPRAPRDDE